MLLLTKHRLPLKTVYNVDFSMTCIPIVFETSL